MTETISVGGPGGLDAAVERAAVVLEQGQPIVMPTDTVYGVALPAADGDATARLAALKGRSPDQPVAVLAGSVDQAASIGVLADPATRLAAVFWPGPLTLVLERPASPRDGDATVGVRVPDHDFARRLAARVGPLATTSANRHGEPTPAAAVDAAAALVGSVGLIVDGGVLDGEPSSVVRVGAGGRMEVLRSGAIAQADLESAHVPTQEGR